MVRCCAARDKRSERDQQEKEKAEADARAKAEVDATEKVAGRQSEWIWIWASSIPTTTSCRMSIHLSATSWGGEEADESLEQRRVFQRGKARKIAK